MLFLLLHYYTNMPDLITTLYYMFISTQICYRFNLCGCGINMNVLIYYQVYDQKGQISSIT